MKLLRWLVVLCLLPGAAVAGLSSIERRSQFEKAMIALMAAATPQLQSAIRDQAAKAYIDAAHNKAWAVYLSNAGYWRSVGHEDAAAAGDRALEGCQLRHGKPCALLAINDEIAVDGELVSQDMPRLHYSGLYDFTQIPIVRLATQRRPDVQLYDKAMEPKAMAIHPWGKVFIAAGDVTLAAAEAAALKKCNDDPDRKGRDGGCFLYALNNYVVLGERRMSAK
jgi:hypothetical protein